MIDVTAFFVMTQMSNVVTRHDVPMMGGPHIRMSIPINAILSQLTVSRPTAGFLPIPTLCDRIDCDIVDNAV